MTAMRIGELQSASDRFPSHLSSMLRLELEAQQVIFETPKWQTRDLATFALLQVLKRRVGVENS